MKSITNVSGAVLSVAGIIIVVVIVGLNTVSISSTKKQLTMLTSETTSLKSQLGAFALGAAPVSTETATTKVMTACSTTPAVTVMSPDGNEVFQTGEAVTVNWKTCNITDVKMAIDLLMKSPTSNETFAFPLSAATANDGTQVVTMPTLATWTRMVYGKNFKVVVRQGGLPRGAQPVEDQSDNFFTIEGNVAIRLNSTNASTQVFSGRNYAQYNMNISVTALDRDIYLDKTFTETTSMSSATSGSNRISVLNSAGTQLTGGFSAVISSSDNNSIEKTNTYKIAQGQTARFTISVSAYGTNAAQRAVLYGLEWGTSDSALLSNVYSTKMGIDGVYKTSLVYVPQ